MRDDARPPAVFDLDGTLADTGHRQYFLEGRRERAGFFAAAVDDPALEVGVRLALTRAEECEIVYPTGRPERCRRDTLAWPAPARAARRAAAHAAQRRPPAGPPHQTGESEAAGPGA